MTGLRAAAQRDDYSVTVKIRKVRTIQWLAKSKSRQQGKTLRKRGRRQNGNEQSLTCPRQRARRSESKRQKLPVAADK
jgi:hypothetical protein